MAAHHLLVQLYTNFGIGYILRSNLPIELSKTRFCRLRRLYGFIPCLVATLYPKLTEDYQQGRDDKEFGLSTSNSQTQSDFIIKGLDLFKNMGLKGCWLVYWNSAFDNYGIRGRPAERTVGEWIAKNAQ